MDINTHLHNREKDEDIHTHLHNIDRENDTHLHNPNPAYTTSFTPTTTVSTMQGSYQLT